MVRRIQMTALKLALSLMLGIVLTSVPGCSRHVAGPPKPSARLTPAEPTWGPQVEGLQCRLRPVKRVCPAGESPTFKIDLRNRGERVFAFLGSEQVPLHGFAVDGQWRRRSSPAPVEGKARALGPGVEILDLAVVLPDEARALLTPGRHVVQLALSFEGVEVPSNPVGIEIVGARP